ncbi:MAG: hypothetical protein KDK78_03435 [Chlamydiia bacterium]|nr:hypothetical protein [Chlamydiia bacterium]
MGELLILDPVERTAQSNMDTDARLLHDLDPLGSAILHHYHWRGPCATYGHFAKPEQLLNLAQAGAAGLNLGKRPTGGGVIFHLTDLAFSFFLPSGHPCYSLNTLDNYRFVNELVIQALRRFRGRELQGALLAAEPQPMTPAAQHFCMAKPTKYDVIVEGRKVGGAAQRRMRQGLLHQGSISITALPEEMLEKVLLPEQRVLDAMRLHTYALCDRLTAKELEEARSELRALLNSAATQALQAF